MLSPDEWREFFQLLQRTQNNTLLAINIIDTVIIDDEGDILCWLFTGKEGKVLKKNADKRTVANLRRTFCQRALHDRTNYLDNVAIERCLTAKVLRDAEFEAQMRQMEKDIKFRGKTASMGKRPYCIQQYVPPYQGLRYVTECVWQQNGEVEQECFASPAPYGVLGDPVELFNMYPTNPKESPPVDPTLQAEIRQSMCNIATHLHERTGNRLARLGAEWIVDRFGKVLLQTVSHFEWKPHEAAATGTAEDAAADASAPVPAAPRQEVVRPRPPQAPRGRPSTARARAPRPPSASTAARSSSTARRRPQSARVARPCRDGQVIELSKAIQTQNKMVESLQGQMRKAQEEAEMLKEELRQKEQDAQVMRLNMKREWEKAIDSRQGGAKGNVNSRVDELRNLVKQQQQHFGLSMSRSMLMFRDELMRVHQEFDRRDRDNLERIRGLEQTVQNLNAEIQRVQHPTTQGQRRPGSRPGPTLQRVTSTPN